MTINAPMPEVDTTPSEGTRAVYAAFQILDAIALAAKPLRMTDIVGALELPKSTVFRLLRALEATGAVVRDQNDRRYRLGSKFDGYTRVSQTPLLVSRFQDKAAPLLRPLNETAQLGVLSGANVTFVACIESPRPVRLVSYVGRVLPAHASATGKAILAFSDDSTVEAVIRAGLTALTPRTVTDASSFRAELRDIRDRGYALESEESTSDLSCVAAPVWGESGQVVGAITICIPRARIPDEQILLLRDVVLAAAQRMSIT